MSFVNEFLETVEDPLYTKIAPAYNSIIIGLDSKAIGLGGLTIEGSNSFESFASLGLGDVNKSYLDTALALVEVGLLSAGKGEGVLDTYGGADKLGQASLNTFNSSPAPSPCLLSFELVRSNIYPALLAMTATGIAQTSGGGGLQILVSSVNVAYYVLTVNSPFAFIAALASIIIGGLEEAESNASFDVSEGRGIDLLVDIIDEILYSGHGDC